jgi:PhnB protein
MDTPPRTPWQPRGYHTIDPYIVVKGAAGFIDFLKAAFDATEDMRVPNPDWTIGHAEVRVADAVLLLFDSKAHGPKPAPSSGST